MEPSDAAEALALELTRQLKDDRRISLLLVPRADVVGGEEVVRFYWLDRDEDGAADTIVRVADHEGEKPETAASRIIGGLSLTD